MRIGLVLLFEDSPGHEPAVLYMHNLNTKKSGYFSAQPPAGVFVYFCTFVVGPCLYTPMGGAGGQNRGMRVEVHEAGSTVNPDPVSLWLLVDSFL